MSLRRAIAWVPVAMLAAGCPGRGDLESPEPRSRAAAVRRLGSEPVERTLPALLLAQVDQSVEVRLAAAEAFARLGGVRCAEGLGPMLGDVDPAVAAAAARGLAALAPEAGGKERLLAGYAVASSAGRAAIAGALLQLGASLREAVEAEARKHNERNQMALERGQPGEQAGAAEELGASGRVEAVNRLAALLLQADRLAPVVLAGVARGLGATGDGAVRPRLERLLASPRPGVAVAGADGLRLLGDPASAGILAEVAGRGGAPGAAAMAALAHLPKAPEVVIALCAVAVSSADPARATQAARLVRQRGAGCPIKPLLGRVGRVGERAALAVLAELRWEGGVAEAVSRRMLAVLAVRGGDPAIRAGAARVVGTAGWPGAADEVVERVAAIFKTIDEARARLIDDPKNPPAFLEPPEAAELGSLLAAGGRLRADGMRPHIVRALTEPSPAIRAGAVEGYGWLAGPAADPVLERALADGDPSVRSGAARALGRQGDAGAPPLVRAASLTRPSDGPWRVELAQALAFTGSAEAAGGLARLLEGESTGAAIQALSQMGASAGVKPLMELVGRGEGVWLPEAVEALASLGGPDAGPSIARLMTSDRAEVREAAVRALGRLRHEPASPGLEALKSDYVGRVRRAAIEALARLPSRRPGGARKGP
jgi:HEAT repeat protein